MAPPIVHDHPHALFRQAAIAAADREAKAADREVKLAVAELGAKVERFALFMEESQLVGARAHEASLSAADAAHEADMAAAEHERTMEAQREGQAHEAALATIPPPVAPGGEATA